LNQLLLLLFLIQTVAVSLSYSASCVSATELADCKAVLTGQLLSLQQASGFSSYACCACMQQKLQDLYSHVSFCSSIAQDTCYILL